ncbi:protein transport protein YOS1 [Tothia fuscella]|uniref:Protein transport protein YOS1 n=1 Tax=Tothia fuscella TaxID=1048955 RepID=A0A9P4P1P0_9PEZI|nr:protein transport protein YOS1 [Tothia fuscella]
MAFLFPSLGLGNIFYVGLLLINGIAIISEDRFLARIGWGSTSAAEPGFGGQVDTSSAKAKIVNLMNSVRTLARLPLIVVNFLVIFYLMILG